MRAGARPGRAPARSWRLPLRMAAAAFVLLAAAATIADAIAAGANVSGRLAPWGTPGTPGYRLPWNRPTRDTVVDLAPGEKADRFEFQGRLIGADDRPLAGAMVYAYHADGYGLYGSKEFPTIPTKAGSVRTGPGGGFVVRSTVPGMYEGPPHIHLEAELAGRGRCTWFVNLRPDSATGPLPGSMNLGTARPSIAADEHQALVHLDADGVYRVKRTMHVASWFAQPGLDSLHAQWERRFERAPWRRPAREQP